ncbi:MAG TPA: hypothetical protein VKW06_00530 [Candidatus Angelobacter sp.]|nr:hypothetical protein [Candidatus Angelobacter sp.]
MKLALCLLALSLSCFAQQADSTSSASQPPSAPQPKVHETLFDPQNVTMFWADATAMAGEIGASCSDTTVSRLDCRNIAIGGAGFMAVEVLGTAVLHKTGHHNFERVLPPAAILFHVARLVYVSTHRK